MLVFLPSLTNGGAERQGALLARRLQAYGYKVSVWGFPSVTGSAPLEAWLDRAGIAHAQLARWPRFTLDFGDWRSPLRTLLVRHRVWPQQVHAFASLLPEARFDVVIPFTFWPSLVAAVMSARFGASKTVWNHRGGFDNAGIQYSSFLIAQISAARPVFVANSSGGAEFLRHTFALAQDQVRVIRNAFVAERPDCSPAAETSRDTRSAIRLIHVANHYPEKDIATLLEATRFLMNKGVKFRLDVVGDFLRSSDREEVEAAIARLGLEGLVSLHHGIDRARADAMIARADIGLLSSRSEGMPNSVMECMYHRLPIVATDIPGVREVVGDANSTWLFRVGDAEGLARRIVALARAPDLRARIGEANRTRIVTRFSEEAVMPAWLDLLTESTRSSGVEDSCRLSTHTIE